jgi:hypothetical protein
MNTNLNNNQELFEFVVKALVKQGKQAMCYKSVTCKYRIHNTDSGKVLKCSIGQIIPDNLYTNDIEHKLVRELYYYNGDNVDVKLVSEYLKKYKLNILIDLQHLHDIVPEINGVWVVDRFISEVNRIAETYSMSKDFMMSLDMSNLVQ